MLRVGYRRSLNGALLAQTLQFTVAGALVSRREGQEINLLQRCRRILLEILDRRGHQFRNDLVDVHATIPGSDHGDKDGLAILPLE